MSLPDTVAADFSFVTFSIVIDMAFCYGESGYKIGNSSAVWKRL